MNVAALQTAVQAKGYGTDTATAQIELLNSVYRRLCGLHRWPWLEKQDTSISTVVGTGSYVLTGITDLLRVDAVHITSGTEYPELEYRPPLELRDLDHVDRATGVPKYWSVLDQKLQFWPRPDKVYSVTIDYIFDPPELVAAGAAPIFDATFHDILVWGAVKEIAFRERDWNAVSWAKNEYEVSLAQMERSYGIRQRQTASHVRQSDFLSRVATQT